MIAGNLTPHESERQSQVITRRLTISRKTSNTPSGMPSASGIEQQQKFGSEPFNSRANQAG
jgi:hypothetical protein